MKSGEINSLFKNLSRVIKNPKSDLKYKNKFQLSFIIAVKYVKFVQIRPLKGRND